MTAFSGCWKDKPVRGGSSTLWQVRSSPQRPFTARLTLPGGNIDHLAKGVVRTTLLWRLIVQPINSKGYSSYRQPALTRARERILLVVTALPWPMLPGWWWGNVVAGWFTCNRVPVGHGCRFRDRYLITLIVYDFTGKPTLTTGNDGICYRIVDGPDVGYSTNIGYSTFTRSPFIALLLYYNNKTLRALY